MKRYISALILFMVTAGYGCTGFKVPVFQDNINNISGYDSDRTTGKYSNPLTTGIDFFISRNYSINLRLNLCGQDNEIDLHETPIRFDPGKIGPIVDCRYYF